MIKNQKEMLIYLTERIRLQELTFYQHVNFSFIIRNWIV